MDKKIILHIGRHKTGTSSIQYFLDRNTSYLSEHGYYYLDFGRGGKIANHSLATALNPRSSSPEKMLEGRERFEKEIRDLKEDKILISSEGFQNIRDLELVEEFFKDYELTVVCYLRECLAYKQSAFCQSVHATGYYGRFSDYATAYKLNYPPFVQKWQALADELVVAMYQKTALASGDVVVDFMSRAGLDVQNDISSLDTLHRNPSIGGNLLYFKLLFNLSAEGAYSARVHYNLLQNIAREDPRFQGKFYISDEEAHSLRQFDHASASFLARRFENVRLESFSEYPALPDRDTLAEDMEYFLGFKEIGEMIQSFGLSQPIFTPVNSVTQ